MPTLANSRRRSRKIASVRSVYSVDSMSIVTSVPISFALARMRATLARHSSSPRSSPSAVSFTETCDCTPLAPMRVEGFQIILGRARGIVGGLDVLAQMIERGGDALRVELADGLNGLLDRFTGDKTAGRAPRQAQAGEPAADGLVARQPEQERSHHTVLSCDKGYRCQTGSEVTLPSYCTVRP